MHVRCNRAAEVIDATLARLGPRTLDAESLSVLVAATVANTLQTQEMLNVGMLPPQVAATMFARCSVAFSLLGLTNNDLTAIFKAAASDLNGAEA